MALQDDLAKIRNPEYQRPTQRAQRAQQAQVQVQATGHQLNNVKGDRAALLTALNGLDPIGWELLARSIFILARGGARIGDGILDQQKWARVRLACDDIFPQERGQDQ